MHTCSWTYSQEYFKKALGLICDNSPNLTLNTSHKGESGHSIPAAVCHLNHLFITFLFILFPSQYGLLSIYCFFSLLWNFRIIQTSDLQHYFYKSVWTWSIQTKFCFPCFRSNFVSCICCLCFLFLASSLPSNAEGLANIWS